MMLAAAEYAETLTGDPPPDLKLVFACRRWNCLPKSGGYLDQPAGVMHRMNTAENVYQSFRGWLEAENGAEYLEKNKQAMNIITLIQDLRKERGNENIVGISGDHSGGEHGGS